MDEAGVFDGIDDIPWADLGHAYGSAEDVPGHLLALASQAPDKVTEALDELWGSITHQGSVYSATVCAVPFLARAAVAGIERPTLVSMLGCIAQSRDERGLDVPGAARAAVAAQIETLMPLLSNQSAEVRVTAAWALVQCRVADRLLPALTARWAVEDDPMVRGGVLQAVAALDSGVGVELGRTALGTHEDPAVRFVAASACLAADCSWDDEMYAAATAWMADGSLLTGYIWGDAPFSGFVRALARRGEGDLAVGLVTAGLAATGPSAGATRWIAMSAADALVRASRGAAAELIAPVTERVGDPELGSSALSLLTALGSLAAHAADAVAFVAEDESSEDADDALAFLVRIGDARAPGLLARNIGARPRALDAVGEKYGAALPFDPSLLEAVRGQIRRGPRPSGGRRSLVDSVAAYNQPGQLVRLLASWGPAAAPAVPELIGLLSSASAMSAAGALAAAGVADRAVLDALHRAVESGVISDRIAAGQALHTLTGDPEPLLTAIESGLGQAARSTHEAVAARDLAGHADRLAPALASALAAAPAPSTTTPAVNAKVETAAALWRMTGDPAPVLPILAEGLAWAAKELVGTWTAIRSAEVAAELGPAAVELAPALRSMLEIDDLCAAAVSALLRICPETPDSEVDDWARRLVATIPAGGDKWNLAVTALAERGARRLPTDVLDELRRLAEQDQRIVRFAIYSMLIHEDEQLRAAIRDLLASVSPECWPAT